jgi:hypothetical protein
MAKRTVTLAEYLRNTGIEADSDFLREGIARLIQLLMEMEVSERIGAEKYERSESRQEYRNGYRDRIWETRVGEIQLQIPKLRRGTYYPSFLEPRRRAERALLALFSVLAPFSVLALDPRLGQIARRLAATPSFCCSPWIRAWPLWPQGLAAGQQLPHPPTPPRLQTTAAPPLPFVVRSSWPPATRAMSAPTAQSLHARPPCGRTSELAMVTGTCRRRC